MLPLLVLLACTGKTPSGGDDTAVGGVHAIVDPARPTHFFDLPFPSDELLRADGTPDLSAYPRSDAQPVGPLIAGWATRLEQTAQGFANEGAAYFRFDGALTGLPEQTLGLPEDPVLWVSLSGTPELLPLDLRFVADPHGDPFWAPDTLAFGPTIGHPPRSGGTYAAVVMRSAGALPPVGYALPAGVADALAAAGVTAEPAVATAFTVQDATGQLHALAADVDARRGATPDWGTVPFKRVVSLAYSQGLTPSGKDATVQTVTFEDGSTELSYQGADEEGDITVDLGADWPMAVYQAELTTLNYSGLDDRPYMSPGLATLGDGARSSGWIQFSNGVLDDTPDEEPMRIVVSLPKGGDGQPRANVPVVIWDHGTGGSAYNSVQRRSMYDNGAEIAARFAQAGTAIIGRDAPLYGTRYPLIDEGYSDSLGFYNIVNLPAFRDNQRQAAVDGHVLLRFVQTGLNGALPAGSVDPTHVRRGGHSLGSVTANLGSAMEPDAFDGLFISGTGGFLTHYFLDTGLIGDLDPSLISTLFGLFGATPPDTVTPAAVVGAALGLDEAAWDNIDRFHPAILLFQWTMDPSDPMTVARDETLPAQMVMGISDHQVPNFTTQALSGALPDATLTECAPGGDYDPHYCFWREQTGWDTLAAWLK